MNKLVIWWLISATIIVFNQDHALFIALISACLFILLLINQCFKTMELNDDEFEQDVRDVMARSNTLHLKSKLEELNKYIKDDED